MIAAPQPHVEEKIDGTTQLALLFVIWTLGWIILFYFVRHVQYLWLQYLPLSTRDHENSPNWCARNVLGMLHALFIAVISLPSFFAFVGAPDDVKFAASPHIATCALDYDDRLAKWSGAGQAVALVGLAFTTFTIADVFIIASSRLATLDHAVHHVAYIAVGLMVRTNCMLPYNASILMLMEVSTPFLNYCTLMLNRGNAYSCSSTVSGTIFAALFVIVRIFLNTYGAIYLCMNYDIAMPLWVPEWEFWFLLLAIVAGAMVQYVWLPVVLRKFAQHFWKPFLQADQPGRDARAALASARSLPADDTDGAQEPEVKTLRAPVRAEQQAGSGSCFQGACSVS